jgi:hypothetical protein
MLDVHPPHQAAHTWKDFFIHIATIVVGLVIAVGLEQTVEFFHHKHELREARSALKQESQTNRAIFETDIHTFWRYEASLARDMQSLQYLKEHPHATRDDLPNALLYDEGWDFFTSANEKVAHEAGTMTLMDHKELARWEDLYRETEEANRDAIELAEAMDQANRVNFAFGNSQTLSPTQVDQAIDRTAAAITKLASLGYDFAGMAEDHPDVFGGLQPPTYQQLEEITLNEDAAADKRYSALIQKTKAAVRAAAARNHLTTP